MRFQVHVLFLLTCATLLSAQIPHLAETPAVFGLLNEISYLSGERMFLTAGGDPLYFQGSLATPQQNVYQLNFRVDEMDLSKATFGLADMKLHLFCKPNITCVWRNTFEGPVSNPGKMSRQEKFSALDLNAKTAEVGNRVLQDLMKLQNLVTFTNPPSTDNSAQAIAALLALAKAAQPQTTVQATPQPPRAAPQATASGPTVGDIAAIIRLVTYSGPRYFDEIRNTSSGFDSENSGKMNWELKKTNEKANQYILPNGDCSIYFDKNYSYVCSFDRIKTIREAKAYMILLRAAVAAGSGWILDPPEATDQPSVIMTFKATHPKWPNGQLSGVLVADGGEPVASFMITTERFVIAR